MAASSSPDVSELEPLPPPATDLWARIRNGFAMPDLDDALVSKWEQWYVSRPDYVARMIDRSRRYLYYIVVEVEERRMPLEIALLPMVESAFNPECGVGRAGVRDLAVHAGYGKSLRPEAELLVRLAA